jgi:spoIIIJ-associated protein
MSDAESDADGDPEDLPEEPAERVEALLEEIVDALDLDGEIVVDERDEEIAARIEGDELGLLIGRRGQTIDAVQLLCYRVAFRGRGDRKRVSVDAAGYRERRRETIERQAERAAERALESGKEIELEPMTPTERKIVHDQLKDRPGLETFSEGEEPERCVIVAPLVGD